jgi:hypothetical protein
MSVDAHTARDDLAFLRALAEAGDDGQRQFGRVYLAAGLIYGAQMLAHGAQALGWIATPSWGGLAIGLGPSALFLAVLSWLLIRHRGGRPTPMARVVAAVFSAVGLANIALVVVVGYVAWREHSLTTWLIYPCAVFILQGAGWMISAVLRRRSWQGWVAAGWVAAGLAMALSVQSMGAYILFAGLGLWACMALPGAILLSAAARPNEG